ncbi:MAG: methylated-DNA--[protein]-cysteine S-methyltransferase [Gordonia sp. (in: high G+C Gram-positive bacteria)]|uniref:methylated-DNA--[protein]-cysteine S-methyltransferase n=1 Tax=Gordonia sp. (in: high G+C Gram-positive bacteria) TaxID=84139 RepID=UPI003C76A223
MTDHNAPTLGWATTTTADGPFTALFDDDFVVYASGWTESPEYLDDLIAPGLRDGGLAERPGGPVLEAVTAFYDGDFTPSARVRVRQEAGPFIEASWEALRRVPAGRTVTYGVLAEHAGRPAAVRAAAQCCVRNAAALFVPCHRVLRWNGGLGGYRYGVDLKASLLQREAASAVGTERPNDSTRVADGLDGTDDAVRLISPR